LISKGFKDRTVKPVFKVNGPFGSVSKREKYLECAPVLCVHEYGKTVHKNLLLQRWNSLKLFAGSGKFPSLPLIQRGAPVPILG
jgi:hypothetical protein